MALASASAVPSICLAVFSLLDSAFALFSLTTISTSQYVRSNSPSLPILLLGATTSRIPTRIHDRVSHQSWKHQPCEKVQISTHRSLFPQAICYYENKSFLGSKNHSTPSKTTSLFSNSNLLSLRNTQSIQTHQRMEA